MKFILSLALMFSFKSLADSDTFAGFVQIKKGLELYVEYDKPKAGKPTLVLLNGLTYSTAQWKLFADALTSKGYGVVRYDMQGMGRTLLKYAPAVEPIQLRTQVKDLQLLLAALKIEKPYNLVGLSYGGGVGIAFSAQYPELINKAFIMAPYTQPQKQQDDWIRSQIWLTRKTQPWNGSSDDDLYDFFLRQIVYSTYPQAEPIILENPFKIEGVFRMIQGIRKWKAASVVQELPADSIHLMVAGSDQYIGREIMLEFWDQIPRRAQESLLIINNSEHKIPESVPYFAAAWIDEVMRGNKLIANGKEFEADPFAGVVKHDGGKFKVSGNKK
jgi:pimeloyl-ACP methyl ester carboxylesterase